MEVTASHRQLSVVAVIHISVYREKWHGRACRPVRGGMTGTTVQVRVMAIASRRAARVAFRPQTDSVGNAVYKAQAPLYVTSRIARTYSAGYPGCP